MSIQSKNVNCKAKISVAFVFKAIITTDVQSAVFPRLTGPIYPNFTQG